MNKGIILAGGTGSRLYPLTQVISKQLLPVYDKPMIYYPLSVLLMAKIREILIISTPRDLPHFRALLGSGEQFGVQFFYQEQPKPEGIAQAFLLAESFIRNEPVCLILGDNIFYGAKLKQMASLIESHEKGGMVFCYEVQDPSRYGVVEFNSEREIVKIHEKPKIPPSYYAVTGLYCYDDQVSSLAQTLRPSYRGELEITDLNNRYLEKKELRACQLERGFAWLDTGTHEALQAASAYVQVIQQRQGIQVCCPEEIAFQEKLIGADKIEEAIKRFKGTDYGKYLETLLFKAFV